MDGSASTKTIHQAKNQIKNLYFEECVQIKVLTAHIKPCLK